MQELDDAVLSLLHRANGSQYQAKSFYAHFILGMKRIFTSKIPSVGVNITSQINLIINPDFFKSLTPRQRVEVLEHECKHIINDHIGRSKNLGMKDHKMWNIACDAAINHNLPSLHEMGVTVEKLRKEMNMPDLEDNRPAEYYYSAIKQFQKDNPQKGQELSDQYGEATDDHGAWEESETNEELADQIVKNQLKKAASEAGSTPHEVRVALENMGKSTVSWKNQLRRFFQRAMHTNKTSTRKKRNRRYGVKVPGKKKKPTATIAIGVDESGSVWNDAFVQFFTEVDVIADYVDIWMIHCDAEVNKVYKYEKGMKIERSGCGGTYYSPAIEKAMEMDVDGMIYFGDGDCFESEVTKPKFPMLWAMIENCQAPVSWGATCEVKVA